MARLPRVVVADVAHHVTQRGNARQVIVDSDTDRLTYLELLHQHCELYHLSLLGYCLMSNHVHLIVVPRTAHSLAQTLKHTHGRYAAYWNGRQLLQRTCVAGPVLFLPARRCPSLDRVTLCRIKSGARRHGGNGLAMEMVQRRHPLRFGLHGDSARPGGVAEAMDDHGVDRISCRGRVIGGTGGTPPIHPYGQAAGKRRLRRPTGAVHLALLAPHRRGRRQKPAASDQQHAITFVA